MDEGVGEQDVLQDSAAVSWHESSSRVFLDDALLLTVSGIWDKIGLWTSLLDAFLCSQVMVCPGFCRLAPTRAAGRAAL